MKKSLIFLMVMCTLVISDSVWADITDGLIGYWPLDEGSGTTTADVAPAGHGNDGTLVDGPLWTSGQFDNALSFDGTNDYVLCAERDGTGPGTYPEELMPENFTVSCWTKLDAFAYFSSLVGNGMDTGSDECGFFLYNYGWQNPDAGREFGLAIRTEAGMYYVDTPSVYNTDTWYHLAATYDGAEANIYVDGQLAAGAYNPMTVGGPIRWVSASSGNYPERFAIGVWLDPGYDLWIDGIIDDVGYWDRALTADEISAIFTKGESLIPPPDPALASNPFPPDEATDVCRNVVLGWTPGDTATGHEVYFGTSDPPAFKTSLAGATTSYTPSGSLSYSTQYFWQIVETGPGGPWPGPIWSFTVEPYSYPLSSEQITATADSNEPGRGPEKTLDLEGDLHSTDTSEMWLSASGVPHPTIKYEFGKVYKLHEMWIWNYNGPDPMLLGYGAKSVDISTSLDDITYTPVGTYTLGKGTSVSDYAHDSNDTYDNEIDLSGVAAQYVKIAVNSNWGFVGIELPQSGLSEVRFFYVPVRARKPDPENEATGVPLDTVLTWRAGRQADTHDVYISTDEQAVADGTVSPASIPAGGTCQVSYGPLSLELGKTYYWKVDEVNLAEEPNTWEGDVWSFSTPEYVVVEDF
ncbi:MAG: discoidin domain-containing protein, partial [Planctomycetes bacterium]|nr:discoidin domain-containing protein [Planctomycetota bacterium]